MNNLDRGGTGFGAALGQIAHGKRCYATYSYRTIISKDFVVQQHDLRRYLSIALAVLLLAFSAGGEDQSAPSWPPNGGFVPDGGTAVKIAEAVLVPIIGEQNVLAHRPFKAALRGATWTVTGTLNCPTANCVGGAPVVKLSKQDGRILNLALPK